MLVMMRVPVPTLRTTNDTEVLVFTWHSRKSIAGGTETEGFRPAFVSFWDAKPGEEMSNPRHSTARTLSRSTGPPLEKEDSYQLCHAARKTNMTAAADPHAHP